MAKDRNTEISEAISAANNALDHLNAAADELDSAESWGLFDMFAGGFVSTAIKHGHMSNAQDEIEAAKDALRAFAGELRDVDESAGLNVEVDGFLQFADFFFDGIVADWLVQSKIDTAKQQVARAIRDVERIRDQLCRM